MADRLGKNKGAQCTQVGHCCPIATDRMAYRVMLVPRSAGDLVLRVGASLVGNTRFLSCCSQRFLASNGLQARGAASLNPRSRLLLASGRGLAESLR
jgi:hypothetical protein